MGEVITITGHSDDVVNIEGNGSGVDEASEGASIIVIGSNDNGNAGVRVKMTYGGKGRPAVWSADISPVEEDMPMLVTTVRGCSNGYSPQVEIHGGKTVIVEAS